MKRGEADRRALIKGARTMPGYSTSCLAGYGHCSFNDRPVLIDLTPKGRRDDTCR